MGIKRFWDEEDFPETSFKQSKLVEYYIKSSSNADESHAANRTSYSPGSNFCKLELDLGFEDGAFSGLTAENKLDASAPLFLETSSSNEEDVGNGSTPVWSSSIPGYIELSIPEQSPEPRVDPYVILFNCSPRKEVPIGPEHQALIPIWDPSASDKNLYLEIDREHRLMGSCILSPPDVKDSEVDGFRAGQGRSECSCLDMGSMRCVRQHVEKAREKFLQNVGDNKFSDLGFHDMGEVVTSKWIPEERWIFQEVLSSNPKSHGRNFWNHLRDAFPNRTMMELVSYYYNVFMLHKRAVQNRSFMLEIDSDDDEEWQGAHHQQSYPWEADDDDQHHQTQNTIFRLVGEEDGDEDSTIESFGEHELLDSDVSWFDNFWPEPETASRDASTGENGSQISASELSDETEQPSLQDT